jgi:DNA-binding IclR family transcriptional regulator
MDQLQSAELVLGLITSHTLARCVHVLADEGVADALGDRPTPAAELAQTCGLNADALHRMLRLLSAHGVFALEGNCYAHTPASRLLRSDHPGSLRSFARIQSGHGREIRYCCTGSDRFL